MPLDHCKECGSSSLDIDTAKGQVVCTVCGEVNESTIIVNDPTYEDNGHGGASIIGTFVSGTSSGAGLGEGFRGFRHGIARSSKEVTFDKIRREINDRGHQLRMEQHNIDKAFNIYKLAFENRLTKGRRNDLVIAAALYITCRCDGGNAQYLMIDFSEQFSVDIYELGRTYIHFTKALHFTLNSIDPCLYIMRFATRLEFGKQTTEVSNTAMRLVQRMKKDHLHVGRRPSGLCGAALLFAARHHGFNRKPADIVRVVKVHESTLRKRMIEFGETPSSLLSFEDFMAVDLEEEQDPPAYKEARRKDRERREQEKRAHFLEKEQSEDMEAEVSDLQRQIEDLLESRKRKSALPVSSGDVHQNRPTSECDDVSQDGENDESAIQQAIEQSTMSSVVACLSGETTNASKAIIAAAPVELGPTLAMMGLGPHTPAPTPTPAVDPGSGELELEGLDDDELDYYILNEHECRLKWARWMTENQDYVKAQEEKEAQEERDRVDGKPEKKKRKVQRKKASTPANSAGEAIEKMLKEKKLSQKINYDVLKQLREGEEMAAAATPTTLQPVPSILAPSFSMPPPPPPGRTPSRRVQFKVETGSSQSPALVKQEAQEDRKPVLAKLEPASASDHEYDDDDIDDDEGDYEEEEEQPESISSLLSQQESMYGDDY